MGVAERTKLEGKKASVVCGVQVDLGKRLVYKMVPAIWSPNNDKT